MSNEVAIECVGRGAMVSVRARGELAVAMVGAFAALAVMAWALWLLV